MPVSTVMELFFEKTHFVHLSYKSYVHWGKKTNHKRSFIVADRTWWKKMEKQEKLFLKRMGKNIARDGK